MSNWLQRASNGVRHSFMLTREEEEGCILSMKRGCKKSFERLVRAHDRLVLSCANYYGRFGTDREELISEGRLALVVAIQHFEPGKGARLNTYATWWIKAHMRRFSLDNRRIVRPPHTRHTRQVLSNLRWFEAKYFAQTGQEPTEEIAAAELRVAPRDIYDIRGFLSNRDKPDDSVLRYYAQTPEQILLEQEARAPFVRAIELALQEFDPRSRAILEARLLRDEPMKLAEIGARFKICRERVRQLEKSATAEFYASVASHLAALRSKRESTPVRSSPRSKRKTGPKKSSVAEGLDGSRASATCNTATLD